MDSKNDAGRSTGCLTAGGIVMLALPVAYVLSSGPAAWLLYDSVGGNDLWNSVYWPVVEAANRTGTLDALAWYIARFL